jgi:hypothetical protein
MATFTGRRFSRGGAFGAVILARTKRRLLPASRMSERSCETVSVMDASLLASSKGCETL